MSDEARKIYQEIEDAMKEKYGEGDDFGCYLCGEWFSISGVMSVIRGVLEGR